MPGTAGRRGLVKVPGAAVALAAEATTNAGDDQTYQITNAAKRVLDPTATITVNIGGVAMPAGGADPWTLNRLTGTVTFASADGARGAVTIDGYYLPLSVAVGVRGYNYSLSAVNADDTDYDSANTDNGFQRRVQTQLDVTGTLTAKWRGDGFFRDALLNADLVVIVLYADRSLKPDLTAWAVLSKAGLSAALESVHDADVEWQGTTDADGRAASQ
jgi:hypothetical protein